MSKTKKLHPVIENILARKNKKVPVKDKRKIVLILLGGAMAGVNGAGALAALSELQLSNAFDEIYSSSSGFCNASYLLSGNPKNGISLYYENFCGHEFINFFKPWNIANIDYVIECVKNVKPLNVKNILSSKTQLHVRIKNKTKNKQEFLEVHKFSAEKYFELMHAAIMMPFLSPGKAKIGRYEYKDVLMDTGWVKLFPQIIKSKPTDVLIIYNTVRQYKHLHKKVSSLFEPNQLYEILPGSWGIAKLETNAKAVKKSAEKMGNLTKKIFGDNKPVSLRISK